MLQVTIQGAEAFDSETNMFVTPVACILTLEHSLVSVSKWESIHETPFLGTQKKTDEQAFDYIRMMIIGDEVSPEIIKTMSDDNLNEINRYIDAKMSATWFNEPKTPQNNNIITAEIIYYWMISFGIPFECQFWHLNRLLTLIKVCNYKNNPKKMSRRDAARQQRELNEQRRAEMGTRG